MFLKTEKITSHESLNQILYQINTQGVPDVFTRVDAYLDFILENLK